MQWQTRRWGTSSRGMIGTMMEGGEFVCALCRGKGVLPSAKARCPACGGRGFVKVTLPAMICAYCNGRGEVPARSNITCTVCGGKGVVSVPEAIDVCLQCRGTGAASDSKLPCLVCRGKGVVSTSEYGEAITKARRQDLAWVAARARQAMPDKIKTIKGHAERSEIQVEPSPIFLQEVPLLAHGQEGDEVGGAGYVGQPQRRRETRMVRAGAVSGLVRRLMATERARMLGGKAIDLGRYALEKRTQRWRESRKRFK